ncbi:endonuclease/exonuclease/phosphatase family protein [Microtetraspora malaysiensis]|uniref:endonuclease/exonuclease/phosphatase family protein n=1 Tax=Microtetraspora malaysiensis TaxID=161358 RepID=UPI003D9095AA
MDRLLARESESKRTEQIQRVMSAMSGDLAASGRTPVLLTGDFNAPSHLDWTPATKRCGYDSVPWPTSVAPEQAGMKDSYRVAHPDPVAAPGITWSPIYTTFTGGYGHDAHTGEPEPQDRIDFVHYKGDIEVTSSEAVVEGAPAPIPNHQDNAWTSDHAAVLTTFAMN